MFRNLRPEGLLLIWSGVPFSCVKNGGFSHERLSFIPCILPEISHKNAASTHEPTFQKTKCAIHPICWMLSLARRLISYVKQVSWLTDTNV